MKAKYFLGGILLGAGFLFTACEEENNDVNNVRFAFSGIAQGDTLELYPGDSLALAFSAENMLSLAVTDLPENWQQKINAGNDSLFITASGDADSSAVYPVIARATGVSGSIAYFNFVIRFNTYNHPDGVLVLNEGNMTSGGGSLIYIGPDGKVIPDVYKKSNGTELGGVSQDLAQADGRIFVISQNGESNLPNSDGMLVIAKASTMKKIDAFTKAELSALSRPTHVAAFDSVNVYIRDTKGIWHLNTSTRQLTFVEGSEKAPQSPMVKINNKLYTYYSSSNKGYIGEIALNENRMVKIQLPESGTTYDINRVLGIQPASNEELWIMATSGDKTSVSKYNLVTGAIQQKEVLATSRPWTSGSVLSAYGNSVYYTSGTSIYELSFDDMTSPERKITDVLSLHPDACMFYNSIAVQPRSGLIFANTIKGYGMDYLTNHIWVIDAASGQSKTSYDNYTRFPAGIYFPQ